MSSNPFDFIHSVSHTKKNLLAEDPDCIKNYNAFLTNRGLSYFPDTILYAVDLNMMPHLDKDMQYTYLLNSIRPRKRFSKWAKEAGDDNLELVKEYYGYNDRRAREALAILTKDQIDAIKKKLEKGGSSK